MTTTLARTIAMGSAKQKNLKLKLVTDELAFLRMAQLTSAAIMRIREKMKKNRILLLIAILIWPVLVFAIGKEKLTVEAQRNDYPPAVIVQAEKIIINTPVIQSEPEPIKEELPEPILVSLGEYMLTAYCSCYECCDEYALNRPIDENGNEIVIGASQEVLVPGYSIAVDPRVIPYGTVVVIDGKEYVTHDCGGAIKGNRIDVYHDDHKEALKFGIQYAEVFTLRGETNGI